MRIFLSTGEPSGDLHAANLAEALRRRIPGAEFVGFGGPRLEAAGARLLYPLVELSVMWFLRVLLNLHVFLRLLREAEDYFREHRPDLVILIDYPGFNWLVAKRARRQGIPVVYYVPPQLWAWAGWRVKKVRRYVDLVLCSLPFEPAWYAERGVPGAEFVGHPYFDELAERVLDAGFLAAEAEKDGPMVAILPGSRTQEIERNLPIMLRAAERVGRERPDIRFGIACLREKHRELAKKVVARHPSLAANLEIHQGRTPELIRLAECCWSVSGSVGLELMVDALPSVVVYKVRRVDLLIARPFIQAKFISLVNLLADRELFPEYLTWRDVSEPMARQALTWLNHPLERAKAAQKLSALRDQVARPGASERAADRIISLLTSRETHPAYRGPHSAPGFGRGGRREGA
ncbi:MAG: lipid-A-disaccharide synthase [Isosphaeraceae bacterium]